MAEVPAESFRVLAPNPILGSVPASALSATGADSPLLSAGTPFNGAAESNDVIGGWWTDLGACPLADCGFLEVAP